jgi:hypothetical protein
VLREKRKGAACLNSAPKQNPTCANSLSFRAEFVATRRPLPFGGLAFLAGLMVRLMLLGPIWETAAQSNPTRTIIKQINPAGGTDF